MRNNKKTQQYKRRNLTHQNIKTEKWFNDYKSPIIEHL